LSLSPGTRLGPYEIVAPLGAGGMGEVFRAKDTRLGREVAIKVVPDLLAGEPEVRARFEREARASSALNHPHICQVYDVGREGDVDYIVMELIDGESLAQRLARGPLPPAEVLRVSAQIADALDRAHRAGIVHRDLKPGNIMLTRQGAKLLDFGLARPSGLGANTPGTPSSPTMSRPLTAAGAIVGTFQYMAPEQLEGGEADARSDIWALGATMYEMATGRHAFEGKSQASLIAAILSSEPRPILEVVPLAPPALDRLVRACLAKDPEERIQTAHDVKLQLKWIAEGGSQAGVPLAVATQRRGRERLAWILAAVTSAIALGALAWIATSQLAPKPARRAVRFSVGLPPGTIGVSWPRLSPDGAMLAFQARDTTGVQSIWIRPLSARAPYLLAGTATAGRPFWSPDSKALAWFSNGKLRRVPVAGGPIEIIGDGYSGSDGTWLGGSILFDGGIGDSIRSIPATGGAIVPMSRLDRARGEIQHAWPCALPDGKHFLFQAMRSSPTGRAIALIRLGTVGSFESVVVDSSESRAEFLPPNHIVYVRDGAVIARRFDPARGVVEGQGIVLGEQAGTTGNTQAFSVSSNGSIAYQGSTGRGAFVIARMDRAGKRLGTVGEPGNLYQIALSPDGQRLVVAIGQPVGTGNEYDLWIRDLKRGTMTRFTFDTATDNWPTWSDRGDTVAFASDRSGTFTIWTRPASGAVGERQVPGLSLPNPAPVQWLDRWLGITSFNRAGDWDAWMVPLDDPGHPVAVGATTFDEHHPKLSPDGRFVVFASDQSGQLEIYAQAFPEPRGRWPISSAGGFNAFWTQGGKEIVFRDGTGSILAAPIAVTADGSLEPGTPVRLFGGVQGGLFPGKWCPTPDGREFYVLQQVNTGDAAANAISVVIDANAELRGR
jgi:serine/threonine protein kinase